MSGNKEAINSNTKNKKIETKTKQVSSRLKRSELQQLLLIVLKNRQGVAPSLVNLGVVTFVRQTGSQTCIFACRTANMFVKSVLDR